MKRPGVGRLVCMRQVYDGGGGGSRLEQLDGRGERPGAGRERGRKGRQEGRGGKQSSQLHSRGSNSEAAAAPIVSADSGGATVLEPGRSSQGRREVAGRSLADCCGAGVGAEGGVERV